MSKVKITFHEHYDNKEKIYENAEAEEDYASQRLDVYRVDAKGKRSKQIGLNIEKLSYGATSGLSSQLL